jgi:molybdopterin molybdotransferase
MSICFEDARSLILENVPTLGVERVLLLDSCGRVLGEDVIAPWPMPLCDNSAMDGFAVRAADCKEGVTLRISGYIPAGGRPEPPVEPGCAVKIMTGAPIPPQCDAVVPFEETEESSDSVRLTAPVALRQHIRFHGEDVSSGDVIIPAATVLRPPEISMLASMGMVMVPVHRRPRVAILSTGDELIELGQPPAEGKIINSNSFSLAAAVRECGGEPVMLGIALDTPEDHRRKLTEGLNCDALITSAGVSSGDRDFVRDVLADLGARQMFWKVAIKPGGPTAFSLKDRIPVFSLPGNPVSTMITFEQFVRPGLLRMMGHQRVVRPFVKGVLKEDTRKKPGKVSFIRVRVTIEDGRYTASTAGDQHTGILRTMVCANGLAVLPREATFLPAGTEVDLQILRDEVTMLRLYS